MSIAKRSRLCILAGLFCITSARSQTNLNPEEWRIDLEYFRQVVHSKYKNLFYNVTAAGFDSTVAEIDKKIGTLSDLQMKIEFTKLVAAFHIGHTSVRLQSGSGNSFTSLVHTLPVRFYLFDDGLYIKSTHSNYKQAVGGKVLKIGNRNTDEALRLFRPMIAYENEQGFKNMLQYYLNVPELLQAAGISTSAEKVTVTYLKDGKENTIVITAEDPVQGPWHGPISVEANWADAYEGLNKPGAVTWLKDPGKLRYFEYMPASKTVYVRHGAVQDENNETIKDYFAKVFRFIDSADVDRLVLDIRLNGGGNNYLNKPVITGVVASRKINRKGHFFIIIGKATFSAAQNLTNELEKYTEAIFVGEPTSENVNFYGDTRIEVLPNSKLNIALSWLWWQNLDPRDKRPWTAPQLAADMRFADYKNGIDPAMDVIMNYKDQEPVEEKLRLLLMKGRTEEALELGRNYIRDPMHRYYVDALEKLINDYGYVLMGVNKPLEAKKVFYVNVQLYPGSANACDSYAEACWKAGDKEEAIKYYKLAIAKDPDGVTGDNARRMLEQIQAGN